MFEFTQKKTEAKIEMIRVVYRRQFHFVSFIWYVFSFVALIFVSHAQGTQKRQNYSIVGKAETTSLPYESAWHRDSVCRRIRFFIFFYFSFSHASECSARGWWNGGAD